LEIIMCRRKKSKNWVREASAVTTWISLLIAFGRLLVDAFSN
jgi:hypothetical protein